MTTILKNRRLQVYFFCMMMLHMAIYIIQPTLPLRIAELAAENTEVITGTVFSMVGLSLAIGSPLISRIRRISYNAILFIGLILGGLFNVLQGITSSVVLLGFERFLFGFAHAAVSVSGNVLVAASSAEEMRGRVFGVLNGFTAIGMVIAPFFGGIIGEHFGNAGSFHGAAGLFFVAALAVWRLKAEAGTENLETRRE